MKKNSIPKLELVFLLLLTGMCPQAHATDDGRNASPQKTYAVDLTLGSATVLTFTEAVTSQTGVLFSYESALSQMPLGDVSVHETAAPLEHILEKVFKGRGFRYKVVDRIVVLTYDTDSARSQLVLVTGRVKDGSGMPLVGASVVVKDTMRGVSAGAEGNYRIFADPDATLVFSYIGYADREERIGTRSAIDVVLEEYEAVLEDVVVVGYGTQSRRTVTAAISKFDGHLLEGIPRQFGRRRPEGTRPRREGRYDRCDTGRRPQIPDPRRIVDQPVERPDRAGRRRSPRNGRAESQRHRIRFVPQGRRGGGHLRFPRVERRDPHHHEERFETPRPPDRIRGAVGLGVARHEVRPDERPRLHPHGASGAHGGVLRRHGSGIGAGRRTVGRHGQYGQIALDDPLPPAGRTGSRRLPMGRRPGEPRAHHRLRGQRPAEPMVRRRMLAELLRRHRRGAATTSNTPPRRVIRTTAGSGSRRAIRASRSTATRLSR